MVRQRTAPGSLSRSGRVSSQLDLPGNTRAFLALEPPHAFRIVPPMDRQQHRDMETIRVVLERGDDPALVRWLSDQFSALFRRLDAIDQHLTRLETVMTAQTDKLIADVTALIDEAMADITRAIAAAQNTSPDPAIDALDARVTGTTQALKDAIKALDPAAPAPTPSPAPAGSAGSGSGL